ncbi:MAG TPA: exodeoxyribonuclease III [Candidatus Cybelea sp.]|nr:exodeoxyribonuclease III [Candidatus Cybelea sp.]
MRIVSWNINSLRMRMGLLRRLVQQEQPDVLCLQEIKVEDALFPMIEVQALGFPHVLHHGMKGYNGVAILSKLPLKTRDPQDWCKKGDSRHGEVLLPGDVELHNFYVPAGGDEPDPALNPKFAHKLQFLDEMRDWFKSRTKPKDAIMVGDLNVAPLENDVWSHKQLLKIVSHTPIEVEKLNAVQQAGGWVDGVRHFTPETEKLYSWWSYRAPDWRKSDKGRRLDHIWVSLALKPRLKTARVLRESRGWDQPSDHVPVLVDID